MTVLASSFSHISPTRARAAAGVGVGEVELDHLAHADLADAVEAERAERVAHRLALRVEDAGLERHVHAGLHPAISSRAWGRVGAAVGLRHDAEAPGDLGVGVGEGAEVLAENVLVELAPGLDVPEPAAVGRDLVGDDQPLEVAVVDPADLDLEVDRAGCRRRGTCPRGSRSRAAPARSCRRCPAGPPS